MALIAGCTLTTPLDHLAGTTDAANGAGGSAGAGGLGGAVDAPVLSAMAANHHRIDLVWSSGLGAVEIERDGNVIRSTVTGTTFQDRGLDPSTEYTYRIRSGAELSPAASATTTAAPRGAYAEHVKSDEPAYWQMEDGTTGLLSDTMGNISAGIINGGTPSPGRVGSGLAFDGVFDNASLRTVHTAESEWGWSWELWIDVAVVHNDSSGLLGCTNTPRFAINLNRVINGGMSLRSNATYVGASTGIAVMSGWHHVVLTLAGAITDAPVIKLYIDGLLAGSHTYDEPVHSPWSRSNQGRNTEGDLKLNVRDTIHAVEGTYDEAAAYDYVLSAAQIQRHFLAAP